MSELNHGPVGPTDGALAARRPLPLSAVDLDPASHLGRWQQRSRERTLPHCIEHLESSGALNNLRAAAGINAADFTGMWFADSDVYKTLEAALWELGRAEDQTLLEFVDTTTQLLRAAQEESGYLNSWFQLRDSDDRWSNLKWGHELYCVGHLLQAAVAAVRAGLAPELVSVARAAADLVVDRFGPDGQDGICGHPEVETALVELYRTTGHRPYLDTARTMIDLRGHGTVLRDNRPLGIGDDRFGTGYFQDHEPVRTAEGATGHAVRQLYLEAGVVDVAVEDRDTELLAASERLWDDLFATKTYLTGAHGSRHRDEAIGDPYELPPDRAYAETCAAIASLQWNWRLLLATGRGRYAEEIERVLFNAIAVATAHDGVHFFYSNPLQLRAGHDGADEDSPSARLSWYGCACCPPNLARLLATAQAYVATGDGGGVQLHLLTAGRVQAHPGGSAVALRIDSDYPWDGIVAVTIERADRDDEWDLTVRIPSWSPGFTASVNGEPVTGTVSDGYLRVRRQWRTGDRLVVDILVEPRVLEAHPAVDAVRGCVALVRGPFVYCLEQADLPDGVALADVQVDPSRIAARRAALAPGAAVVLDLAGQVRADRSAQLYRVAGTDDGARGRPIELTAVPYFAWGNRDSAAMRVWLPTVNSDRPRPTSTAGA